MHPLFAVVPEIIKNYFLLFLDPVFISLMLLVVVLVALQYRRLESVRAAMFGVIASGVWRDTLAATLFGLAGGLVGSILMILVGLPLTSSGSAFFLLLLISALLMLINPRFLCFSYAGGIISILNILTGLPDINIYQILGLVALLHMVESILIFFSGHLGAVPAFFSDGKTGRVTGGFTLQKFWPIPLVALTVIGYPATQDVLWEMPGWWPLIKPGGGYESHLFSYALVSVVAGLGYGDLAIVRSPREKSRISAFYLAMYSIALFSLSVSAQYIPALAPAAALFSPLGHELVIYLGKRIEFTGKPLYSPSPRGIRVIDVLKGYTAWRMGIRPGDIILSVNGIPVRDSIGLKFVLGGCPCPGPLEIEYLKGPEEVFRRGIYYRLDKNRPLGLLTVDAEGGRVSVRSGGLPWRRLLSWWNKIKR
ncbi:MAG: PDZ domain-containing protein [Bacillota bacterium]